MADAAATTIQKPKRAPRSKKKAAAEPVAEPVAAPPVPAQPEPEPEPAPAEPAAESPPAKAKKPRSPAQIESFKKAQAALAEKRAAKKAELDAAAPKKK